MSVPPTLSRAVHDRAGLHREDQAWQDAAWERGRVLPLHEDGSAPVVADGETLRLDLRGSEQVDQLADRMFLGEHDGTAYFAVLAGAGGPSANLRDVGDRLDGLDSGLLTTAVALSAWHRRNHFCPRCGSPTRVTGAGWTRTCTNEGSVHFPRIEPSMIVLVHDGGDRCVLGRQASWPEGRFSILAGFVEAGESAEGAVIREVGEEVGLTVDDITYVASQPWPFPSSLMLGFTARVTGPDTIRRVDDELADAGWFTRDEVRAAVTWGEHEDPTARLRALPGPVSIARRILDDWLAGG